MADNLREILDIARREMPDVPDEVWARFENLTRYNFGAQNLYIAARKKRSHLETMARIGEQADNQRLASLLGITVRTVQRLKKLT